MDALVRAGRPGARALQKVVADRPRHVNLLLLLRLAAETCGTVLLTVALMRLIQPVWAGALTAWGIMLVVSYVLIGVGPRTLGRQHPYRVGMLIAAPIRALATLLGPLTKLLILIGNAITPGQGFRQGPFSSEVELRELVDMASTSGVVDEGERQMIHSVFELGDTLVREVMVPRPDVVWTEHDTPVDKVLRLALKSGYSRIPVLGEDIDDIVGVAYLKDLVRAREEAADGDAGRAAEVMRPAVFVPDSKRVDELLKEMQATRNHMAIVVDEYGGTAGVVTIEDLLEEIVGEITDEYDLAEVPDVQVLDGRPAAAVRPAAGDRPAGAVPRASTARTRSWSRCWPRPTWTPSAACWPSSSARCRCPAPRPRSPGWRCWPRAATTRGAGCGSPPCWWSRSTRRPGTGCTAATATAPTERPTTPTATMTDDSGADRADRREESDARFR